MPSLSFNSTDSSQTNSFPIEANNLVGTVPIELGYFSQLDVLALGDGKLTGTIPTELGLLGNSLSFLQLAANDLRGSFPTELNNLINIEILSLLGNALSGTLPQLLTKANNDGLTPLARAKDRAENNSEDYTAIIACVERATLNSTPQPR